MSMEPTVSEDYMKQQCSEAVVKVPPTWGIILFVIDIFLPGVGTIISSLFVAPFNSTALCYGIL